MMKTEQSEQTLVLAIVTAISQALTEGADATAQSLAGTLGTALVETGRVSGQQPEIGFFVSLVGAKASWEQAEPLAWTAWEAALRRSQGK